MKIVRYSSFAMALVAPFLLVLLIGSFNTPGPDETILRRIKVLEDDRYLENWELARYAQDEDARVRRAAMVALGRIGHPGAKAPLVTALEDLDREVRAAAVFALGQLGDSTLVAELLPMLDDPIHRVRTNTIEALGKVGNRAATLRLLDLLDSQSPDLRGEAALALGRIKDREVTGALSTLLTTDSDPDVRWRIAYALRWIEDPRAIPALEQALADEHTLVVIAAAKALAIFEGSVRWKPLIPSLEHEDWRVQANAIVAIGSSLDTSSVSALIGAVNSPNHHVRTAACMVLGEMRNRRASEVLRKSLKDPSPAVRAKAAKALALVAEQNALLDLEEMTADRSRYVRAKVYEALGEINSREAYGLLSRGLESEDSVIRAAAVSGLPKLTQRGAIKSLIAALEDEDWVIAAVAAEVLGEPRFGSAVEPLKKTYQAYSGGEADVRLAVISSLRGIGAKKTKATLKAALEDPDVRVRQEAQAALKEIFNKDFEIAPAIYGKGTRDGSDLNVSLGERKVRIKTVRGDIVCLLRGDDAPQTVANFLRLAGEGFYDGITFHRVVPNFVIQAGCPHGDGWGGPGYTIRCEINEHRYLTGTIGMALSGKDTGGSQFFITHSPQPHLDGRYTAFGQVLEGREIVDAIEPGDEILAIEEL